MNKFRKFLAVAALALALTTPALSRAEYSNPNGGDYRDAVIITTAGYATGILLEHEAQRLNWSPTSQVITRTLTSLFVGAMTEYWLQSTRTNEVRPYGFSNERAALGLVGASLTFLQLKF